MNRMQREDRNNREPEYPGGRAEPSHGRGVQPRGRRNETLRKRKREALRRKRRVRLARSGIAVAVLLMLCLFFRRVRTGGSLGLTDSLRRELTVRELKDDGYPDSLVKLYESNPETADFVRDYEKNKDRHDPIDISAEVEQGTIPLFLQWDERWGYEIYGSDMLALTGCGPTALSMVYCGLTGATDQNPYAVAKLAEDEGYYVPGSGTQWSMMEELAEQLGLSVEKIRYDEDSILGALSAGQPIICIMGPGDFTTTGHFIVLTGVDADGRILIHDPNSRLRSGRTWDIGTLMPQIRDLWGYAT